MLGGLFHLGGGAQVQGKGLNAQREKGGNLQPLQLAT